MAESETCQKLHDEVLKSLPFVTKLKSARLAPPHHPPDSAGDSSRESLKKAFALAYFLHPEKELALRIAFSALAKVEVAAMAQTKRLYYRGTSRSRSKAASFRTKVTLSEIQLLQRLVYIESEPFERQKESDPGRFQLTEEDLVVHFVKHLVQITVKRNAFYVCLGVGRLLHDYTTREAMQVFDAQVDDPDRMKDDDYCRSRKAVLMREIQIRFGELLRTLQGPRGEERFEARPLGQSSPLVVASLDAFVPWATACWGATRSITGQPPITTVNEQEREVQRMHVILHPGCFRRLAETLGLDSPERRLTIPRFFLSQDSEGQGPRGDRNRPPDLSEEEISWVGRYLADLAARRRSSAAGLLRVLVDGTERARLDPLTASRARLEADSDAEAIEVRARFGTEDLLLATHLLQTREAEKPPPGSSSIRLEGGQEISFNVEASRDLAGEPTGWQVEVAYRETNPVRAASLLLRRWASRLEKVRSFPRPSVLSALIAAVVLALTLPLLLRPSASSLVPLGADSAKRLPQSHPTGIPSAPLALTEVQPPGQAARQHQSRSDVSDTERVRSLETVEAPVALSQVRKVFIRLNGDHPMGEQLRESLIREIRGSSRFVVAARPEDAEGALSLILGGSSARSDSISVRVQLLAANGKALWPSGAAKTYRGTPADLGSRIVRDLLLATN